ncbi:MAG: hypothetical protein RLZZ453_688 [Chlamydiota bacterium]
MKYSACSLLMLMGLFLCGCNDGSDKEGVVSSRYVHKYGYAIAEEDWASKNYPGQQISTLRNGVTVTTTYENGIQHGPVTYTYPHSQMVEKYCLYNLGEKVKEVTYDPSGLPVQEWVQLSPTRYSMTYWFGQGSPMRVEEFVGDELLDGQYYNIQNELEARVERGNGTRMIRHRDGGLLAREAIDSGYAIKKETFYPNGSPESVAHYLRGALNGEKRVFAQTGEPLAIEEWVANQLHGKCSYFENGNRYLETYYLYGKKEGIERQFVDGEAVAQETPWEGGLKHGEAVYYADGKMHSEWYYQGELVSHHKFNELNRVDAIISRLPYRNESSSR